MPLTIFGKRSVKSRPDSVKVGFRTNDLESRNVGAARSGGGIQPGAHPEFNAETPGEKLVNFGKRVIAKFRKK